jgi:hypothetical protein
MRSANLLIVAYKAYKRGQPDIATAIFAEAMEDESSPELMEKLFEMDSLAGMDDNDNDNDNDNDDNDNDNDDNMDNDNDDSQASMPMLSKASVRKLHGIANRIAAEDGGAHRDIAKRLLRAIKPLKR